MKKLKTFFALPFFCLALSQTSYSQEYLDSDKRFMKLTEVSTDKHYGFDVKKPINVGPNDKAIGAYLNSLKTLDGDKIHIGDMKLNYKNEIGLTMIVLTYEQKKNETTTVYLSTTKFEQPKAILGFTYKTMDDIPKVVVFPADSIVKVTACSGTIYSVDDFLLKEKIGEKPKPTANPTFKGDLDALKKYVAAHPLTDEKATQMIFRVSIAFVVNCEGKAGNFEIVTKGRGDLATYANQVLAIVNRMPQQWQPATLDGKPVDCYQVLSFSVIKGLLDNVSYR